MPTHPDHTRDRVGNQENFRHSELNEHHIAFAPPLKDRGTTVDIPMGLKGIFSTSSSGARIKYACKPGILD
jgi:hypothetical protein